MSANEITPAELTKVLDNAAENVDKFLAPVVAATAGRVRDTQRANVRRKDDLTYNSIRATAPGGRELGPKDLEAEIGPEWFVGRILELGLGNLKAPYPFVSGSLDPHLARHQREILEAGTTGALARLVK